MYLVMQNRQKSVTIGSGAFPIEKLGKRFVEKGSKYENPWADEVVPNRNANRGIDIDILMRQCAQLLFGGCFSTVGNRS